MSDLLTPISDVVQTQFEASRRIADALFYGVSKIDHAMLDATHHVVDDRLRFAQAIGNVRDFQTYSNLQSTYWVGKPGEVQMFQKKMVQIITEMQNQLGRAAQSYIEQISAKRSRGMPADAFGFGNRAGASANPFSSMMSAWENTMRGMSTLAGQAISTARSGATKAGVAAGQLAVETMLETPATLTDQVSSVEVDSDDVEGEIGGAIDETHEGRRHQNGVESRSDQKHPGQPRRK